MLIMCVLIFFIIYSFVLNEYKKNGRALIIKTLPHNYEKFKRFILIQ